MPLTDGDPGTTDTWSEDLSRDFQDFGECLVPDRQRQRHIMAEILAHGLSAGDFGAQPLVVELACGDGTLAAHLLDRLPTARFLALDGSEAMRAESAQSLTRHAGRAEIATFALEDPSWAEGLRAAACVSSLAIHHLDGPGKQALFETVGRTLLPGGVFVVADLVKPATAAGWHIAADLWDQAVREREQDLGTPGAHAYFRDTGWNFYEQPQPDPVDRPSTIFEQLLWLEASGFRDVDVYWMHAGHAIFAGLKK